MSVKFGQNFLISKRVAEREVEYADISIDDVILEIGPGRGFLTNFLAENAKKVIAIEIDKKLVDYLKGVVVPGNVELVCDDVLNVDFNNLPVFNKIVSNLPFEISSPVTFKMLDFGFDVAVLIYQKEFADRMAARPGSKNYSRLSIGVYYKCFCEVLDSVPRGCFSPVPRVDSAIVKLVPRKKPPFFVKDEKYFFDVVRVLFNNRRKMIKNSFKDADSDVIKGLPFSDKRVDVLSPEELGVVSDYLFDNSVKV